MGNSKSCCVHRPNSSSSSNVTSNNRKFKKKKSKADNGGLPSYSSSVHGRTPVLNYSDDNADGVIGVDGLVNGDHGRDESVGNLQHISEREPDDWEEDPSLHPTTETMFMGKSKMQNGVDRRRSHIHLAHSRSIVELRSGGASGIKKSSSCSTIFLDDSTVSQPNLKNTIKCVALAIYYHIKNRSSDQILEIFDERLHPLTRDPVPNDYARYNPEHRTIYRFIRTLFNAAQLTAECAIITLVYLERLLKYAEVDIAPGSWKRITLGAILLASKVWDDQAVWNVDYCQILKDLTVEDMNELERQFLELLQFNINVPSSVYAKYYFDLRTLADSNDISLPAAEPLSKERAQKLEAMSQLCDDKLNHDMIQNGMKRFHYPGDLPPDEPDTIILPGVPEFPVAYDQTANYHFPLLVERNLTGYVGGPAEATSDGPFGFGSAVVTKTKNECIVKSNYPAVGDKCVGQVSETNCPDGFSMSIWEKVVYGEEVFNVRVAHPRKYIVSTGGDYQGDKVYPGIALYHEGINLVAMVSTGMDVWHLNVTGQLVNETWSNIGIRWHPNVSPETSTGGLELYVNAKKVGHTISPLTRPNFNATSNDKGRWSIATPQQPLATRGHQNQSITQNPPYIMIGCHKRSDEAQFGQFNYKGSKYDELALWTRQLVVNRTHNEIMYFMGGYVDKFAGLTLDQWRKVLDKVQLTDHGQLETASVLTQRFFAIEAEKNQQMTPEQWIKQQNATGNNTSSNDTSGFDYSTFPRSTQQLNDYKRMIIEVATVKKLIALEAPKALFRPRDLRRIFASIPTASLVLSNKPSNIEGWKAIQVDPNEPGASEILESIEKFGLSFILTADIDYPESFHPIYDAKRKEMVVHTNSEAMAMSLLKIKPEELQKNGGAIDVANYFANHPLNPNKKWTQFQEKIQFPTSFTFMKSESCSGLDLGVTFGIHDGYGHFGPTRRNPSAMYAPRVKLDSRAITVEGSFIDAKNVTRNLTDCQLDPAKMKYTPIKMLFIHLDQQSSRRKLLWHANEMKTEIEQRQCVVWNPDIGASGAWDTAGCRTIITEQGETVCECAKFGTFAVIAEMIEAPSAPDEAKWLKVVKYMGMVFSIILLLAMILLLGLFRRVHDMFHILRLHTAVCYLIAFFALVATQNRHNCHDRHKNILISAMQQIFFGIVGNLICAESFATFRAITNGIVGGKTWAYLLLSYGFPLINTGLTMYLYGDDYGKDPRCFIGWENTTKDVFLIYLLAVASIALVFGLIIVLNMASPRTRREGALDQLASQGNGLSITIFLWAMTWAFAYPAVTRHPDKEMADFWPIFAILITWFGVVIFVFLGVLSQKLRHAILSLSKPETWKKLGNQYHIGEPSDDPSLSATFTSLSSAKDTTEEEEKNSRPTSAISKDDSESSSDSSAESDSETDDTNDDKDGN